jgi:hypothetical protein
MEDSGNGQEAVAPKARHDERIDTLSKAGDTVEMGEEVWSTTKVNGIATSKGVRDAKT